MRLLKEMMVFAMLVGLHAVTIGQKKHTVPPAFPNLFDELSIDDPAKNSILKENEKPEKKIRENILLKATVNKQQCYTGEPILLTWHLFSSLQSTSAIVKRPGLFGFNITELDTNNEHVTYENINGRRYRRFMVQQLQLVPFQAGKLSIDSLEVNNTVRYQDKNDHTIEYAGSVSSNKLDITVVPLPANGKPENFSGLVGNYSIQLTVKSDTLHASENNTLYITIVGTGGFTDLPEPVVAWPVGIEHFPGHTNSKIEKKVFLADGYITFNIPFVAMQAGTYTIPPVSVAFFDPVAKAYKSAHSNMLAVTMSPPKLVPAPSIFIQQPEVTRHYWPYILAVTIITGIASIWLLLHKRQQSLNAAKAALVATLAEQPAAVPDSAAVLAIKEIQQLEAHENATGFVTGIKRILMDYLQAVLHNNRLVEENIRTLELAHPVWAAQVQSLSNQCNTLLYSPGEPNMTTRKELAAQLFEVIMKGNDILTENVFEYHPVKK